jgi:DNA polymerase-3 subunit epsilon
MASDSTPGQADAKGLGLARSLRKAVDYLLDRPLVHGELQQRLDRWRAVPAVDLARSHADTRYVVVATGAADGLPRQRRLAAVGAVAVSAGAIDFGDAFERVLKPQRSVADGAAAVQGMAGDGQQAAPEPGTAMLEFLEFVGKSPLVAYRADEHLSAVAREVRSLLGHPLELPWLDLAVLLDTVFPTANCASREDWLARFGLDYDAGRSTVGEAFAAAQLLQIALAAAERAGRADAAAIIAVQKSRSTYGRYR